MKKLEIIIRPEKLEELESILDESDVNGLMITNIMGYGHQKGLRRMYHGADTKANLLLKMKVETVVEDKVADEIIEAILKRINTGDYGDGKIFVYEVADTVRIRTGEHGLDAL